MLYMSIVKPCVWSSADSRLVRWMVHVVALLDLDLVGREVAADRGHEDVDLVAVALDALLAGLDARTGPCSLGDGLVPGG